VIVCSSSSCIDWWKPGRPVRGQERPPMRRRLPHRLGPARNRTRTRPAGSITPFLRFLVRNCSNESGDQSLACPTVRGLRSNSSRLVQLTLNQRVPSSSPSAPPRNHTKTGSWLAGSRRADASCVPV
jgi:hypothetical protein